LNRAIARVFNPLESEKEMSLKAADLFEQLTGQLAIDVAEKVRMDLDLGTFIKEEIDYQALAEKTHELIDTADLANDVMDKLDYTDIASNLDMSDLAREVSDELDLEDIADNLDVEKIARTIRNNHADELAVEVAGHLIRSDVLLEKMGEIADDRIAAATDVSQLVRNEVRSVLLDLVILLTGPAAPSAPVDLGELRLESVTPT
jgi:hypothetical protein